MTNLYLCYLKRCDLAHVQIVHRATDGPPTIYAAALSLPNLPCPPHVLLQTYSFHVPYISPATEPCPQTAA